MHSNTSHLIRYTTLLLQLILFVVFYLCWTQAPFHLEIPFFSQWGLSLNMALDSYNEYLLLLTVILFPLVTLASMHSIKEKVFSFHLMLLLSQILTMGTFLFQNLITFYVFWEASIIPMFFIIGVWGGEKRVEATYKFLLFTAIGTLMMLAAILYLGVTFYQTQGHLSYEMKELLALKGLPLETQLYLMGAFLLAFMIKIPMPPFHTWLPLAHVEAPTPGSMILAGILLKMGVYGVMKFALPLFPEAFAYSQFFLIALAALGAVYGSLLAWVQDDLKKVIAYSSIGHMGLLMVGAFIGGELGTRGAMIHALGHGLSSAGLFFAVGMLYERYHTKALSAYGGLALKLPILAGFFIFLTLSSIGFPGTVGFTAEFFILMSNFQWAYHDMATQPWNFVLAGLALSGVLLSAIYMLRIVARVFWGSLKAPESQFRDASFREMMILAVLSILILYWGLFPNSMLESLKGLL